jgi:hypothetical protein
MIIAISGLTFDEAGNKGSAGAGKSTVCNRLVEKHSFVEVAFADPMKRFLREVLDFSEMQLWGPSELRNAPDSRYVRQPKGSLGTLNGLPNPAEDVHLTARHALQTLGTEWARRECWPDIWAAYAMRIAKEILTNRIKYDHVEGATDGTNSLRGAEPPRGVVFSDMRFKNEFDYIKKNGGKVIRVVRPVPLLEVSSGHQSENDLNDVPDSEFDHVIYGQPNDTHDLCLQADRMVDWMRGRIRAYDAETENVPPFLREPMPTGVEVGIGVANLRGVAKLELYSDKKQCCERDTDGDGDCPVHRR